MNTYRTHAQLSSALRALGRVEDCLHSRRSSLREKLLCQIRWYYLNFRVRLLIDRLHSH